MVYILDAYNVIHKIKALEAALSRDLRAAREALIAFCQALLQRRGDISKMVLVFDGKTEFNDLSHPAPPKIQLIFSNTGEPADERIVEVLEKLGKNARKCVVSDDNFVRNQARAYQAPVMSVAEFEKLGRPPGTNAALPSSKSHLSSSAAAKITAEYKKKLGLD